MNYLRKNLIIIGALFLLIFSALITIIPMTPSPEEEGIIHLMGAGFMLTSIIILFLADKVSRIEK